MTEGWSNGAPPAGESHYVREGYAACGLKSFYEGPVYPSPPAVPCEDCRLMQEASS